MTWRTLFMLWGAFALGYLTAALMFTLSRGTR